MDIKRLLEESSKYLMNTYNRYPLILRKGRGTKVYSVDGKEYLDFVGGIAVNILGHCHPRVVVAIQKHTEAGPEAPSRLQSLSHRTTDKTGQITRGKLLCRQGLFLQLRRRGQRGGN